MTNYTAARNDLKKFTSALKSAALLDEVLALAEKAEKEHEAIVRDNASLTQQLEAKQREVEAATARVVELQAEQARLEQAVEAIRSTLRRAQV